MVPESNNAFNVSYLNERGHTMRLYDTVHQLAIPAWLIAEDGAVVSMSSLSFTQPLASLFRTKTCTPHTHGCMLHAYVHNITYKPISDILSMKEHLGICIFYELNGKICDFFILRIAKKMNVLILSPNLQDTKDCLISTSNKEKSDEKRYNTLL